MRCSALLPSRRGAGRLTIEESLGGIAFRPCVFTSLILYRIAVLTFGGYSGPHAAALMAAVSSHWILGNLLGKSFTLLLCLALSILGVTMISPTATTRSTEVTRLVEVARPPTNQDAGIGADIGLSDPVFRKRLAERGLDPGKIEDMPKIGELSIDQVWHGERSP